MTNQLKKIAILIPVFNDWASTAKLLVKIDEHVKTIKYDFDVIILNDASFISDNALTEHTPVHIKHIHIIDLKRNVGHQKAIAVGLSSINEENTYDAVIVMDGDGEDDPKYLSLLIEACEKNNQKKITFAERHRRSEGFLFRVFYLIYKLLFRLATGENISYGNYSIIPSNILKKVITLTEIWNHFAAGILKSKIPFDSIPTDRQQRLSGKPQMKFVDLLTHALKSISVYADKAGARLLISITILISLFITLAVIVVGIRLFTNWAVPGWATYTVSFLILGVLQAFLTSIIFLFMSLFFHNTQFFFASFNFNELIANKRTIYPRS